MRLLRLPRSVNGTAMILALICAGVLAGIGAGTFYVVQSKYRVVHQSAAWKESLLSAEAGVELAMNEIRKSLFDPATAFADWGRTGGDSASPTPTYSFTSQALLRVSEGSQRSWAEVKVDAPSFLKDRSGEQWYRIRAIGICEVPTGSTAAGERQDTRLRKLDLTYNRRTGTRVLRPQVGRSIEAIAKPVGAFRVALLGTGTINFNNQNIVVDSYDSRDATKSTNGRYDPAKRQQNGDVATNGTLITAGGAYIHGDALTNGGTVLDTSNVSGEIRNDFYQEVFAVTRPATLPDTGTPSAISSATVVTARATTPSSLVVSTINLSGTDVLQIRGAPDGSPTYCQIVVTGNINLSGQSGVKLDPGVHLRIFVQGDVDVAGQGFVNPNSALNLQLYGCDRSDPDEYGTMKIAGNGAFTGSIYAPNYDVEMKGGGSADSIFGSVVSHQVTMTGVQAVHYDEALADGGLISDYKIVSWFEDER